MLRRFERIGLQIMNRTGGGGPFDSNPVAGVLGDPSKRALAAQILGQGYVTAHNLAQTNRAAIERIAEVLEQRLEIMGDELLELLDSVGLRMPEFDLGDEDAWPPVEFSAMGTGMRGGFMQGTSPQLPQAADSTPGQEEPA